MPETEVGQAAGNVQDTGQGGTPPAPPPPAAPGVTPGVTPAAPPSAPPSAPPAGASPGEGQPPVVVETKFPQAALDRITEESGKRKTLEGQVKDLLAANAAQDTKIRTFMGVEAQEKIDPNTQALRDDLESVYPGLGELVGMRERLGKMSDGYDTLQDSSDQQWRYFARGVQRLAHAEAAKHLGTLTPRTKEVINATFSRFINTEENRQRYYEGQHDELVDDFINNWVLEGMVNPARAHANAGTVARVAGNRATPQGGGQGVTASPTAGKEKPKNAKEAAARMWTQSQATK